MRASTYARALFELVHTKPLEEETLVQNFAQTVNANGHAHLFPKILKSFARINAKHEAKRTIEVISSVPLEESELLMLLKKEPFSTALTKEHKNVTRRIDETLIGGAVVKTGNMRIDGSYKRMLLDLYQNIIKN